MFLVACGPDRRVALAEKLMAEKETDSAIAVMQEIKEPQNNLTDRDYALWYRDTTEDMNKYDGKTVSFTALVAIGKDFPTDTFVGGRKLMTCCANDITCLGFLCRGDLKPSKTQWYTLTAKAQTVYNKAQDHEVVALMQVSAEPTEKAKDQYVTFN